MTLEGFFCAPFPIFESLPLKLQIPWRHCRNPTILFLLPHLPLWMGLWPSRALGQPWCVPGVRAEQWEALLGDCLTCTQHGIPVLTVPGHRGSILITKSCAFTVGPDLQTKQSTINNWTPVSVKVKLYSKCWDLKYSWKGHLNLFLKKAPTLLFG